jgi:hypothetical protein
MGTLCPDMMINYQVKPEFIRTTAYEYTGPNQVLDGVRFELSMGCETAECYYHGEFFGYAEPGDVLVYHEYAASRYWESYSKNEFEELYEVSKQ